MGPYSLLPNSHSSQSFSCRPRFLKTSRAPCDMNTTEGNLLVTMATVLGAWPPAARLSIRVLGTVVPGSWPMT